MNERTIRYDPRVDCPTAEEMIGYREGKLSAEQEETIRRHLTMCSICVDTLLEAKATATAELAPLEPLPHLAQAVNAIARDAWEKRFAKRAHDAGQRAAGAG